MLCLVRCALYDVYTYKCVYMYVCDVCCDCVCGNGWWMDRVMGVCVMSCAMMGGIL